MNDIIDSASTEEGIGFSPDVFEAVQEFSRFNYENIYKSDILMGYTRYVNRLIRLVLNYLEEIYSSYGMDKSGYDSEHNMLASGFYNHIVEMQPIYIEKEGSDRRMVMDYVTGMTDNFTLDAAKEILVPDHLNEEIENSRTGKWFDAGRN